MAPPLLVKLEFLNWHTIVGDGYIKKRKNKQIRTFLQRLHEGILSIADRRKKMRKLRKSRKVWSKIIEKDQQTREEFISLLQKLEISYEEFCDARLWFAPSYRFPFEKASK